MTEEEAIEMVRRDITDATEAIGRASSGLKELAAFRGAPDFGIERLHTDLLDAQHGLHEWLSDRPT